MPAAFEVSTANANPMNPSYLSTDDASTDTEPVVEAPTPLSELVSTKTMKLSFGTFPAPPGLELPPMLGEDRDDSPGMLDAGSYLPWKVGASGCYTDATEKSSDYVRSSIEFMPALLPEAATFARDLPRLLPQQAQSRRRAKGSGCQHKFFRRGKTEVFTEDDRWFSKTGKGRLSVVSSHQVHVQGVVRYCVQFESGELSNADGVGLVFNSRVPVTSDLHKISAIFLNRTGRICKRSQDKVDRIPIRLPEIELGDVIEIENNLDGQCVSFKIWPLAGPPSEVAIVDYGVLENILTTKTGRNPSFLAVVVKNVGTSARLVPDSAAGRCGRQWHDTPFVNSL